MIQAFFQWNNVRYEVDLSCGVDLSTPYGAPNSVSAWGSPPVRFEPVRYGDWVGSVAAGASVNFFDIQLNPHGNGTHTEWAGHILPERGSVNDQLRLFWFPALLADVRVEGDGSIQEPFSLMEHQHLPEAVILRTSKSYTPPEDGNYSGAHPPYLLPEFAQTLAKKGVQHLLIDLPSVDPEEDGGALSAHKAFWGIDKGELRSGATISELLRIPASLQEGLYLLNLQMAPIANDASPSRPIVFPWIHAHES